ncbi:MAG: ABC transporter ATP-binding protein [Akkermansiaceae bacterium]
MNLLEVHGVSKTYRRGDSAALSEVSFQLEKQRILALVGASGSGKTTMLRILAGLEVPDAGEVLLNGRVIAAPKKVVAAEESGIGMVFQNHALFPHLTVEGNVLFGVRKLPKVEKRTLLKELLELVGLPDKAKRFPHELSGGERQRVALARALAPGPQLLLLDEPFSSLDMRLRQSVRDETREILRARGTAAIFVTHDTEDSLAVADHIVVIKEGRVQQQGAPEEVYHAPANPYVATFFGSCNFLPFHLLGSLEKARVSCHVGPPSASDGERGLWIRPEHLWLEKSSEGGGVLQGEVERVSFAGSFQRVFLKCRGEFTVEVRHSQGFPVEVGQVWGISPVRRG